MKSYPRPQMNLDYAPFYEGIQRRRLLIQKCEECGSLQHPPGPMCGRCTHIGWSYKECSLQGAPYSYTVHCYPPIDGFNSPYAVGLVDMKDGFRLVAGIQGLPLDQIKIGMPLKLEFAEVEPDYVLFRFVSVS